MLFNNLNKRKNKLEQNKILWEKEKQILQEEQKILKEKQELIPKKKFISTSKLIILFLFINCTLLEIFTGYITIQDLKLAETIGSVDFTPIVTLISAVVSQVIGFAIYSAKASKENTQGGIIYDTAMKKLDQITYDIYDKQQNLQDLQDELYDDNQEIKG